MSLTIREEEDAVEAYDKAKDDFSTWDIHLLYDTTLFNFIAKRWLDSLSECSILDVQERWLKLQSDVEFIF